MLPCLRPATSEKNYKGRGSYYWVQSGMDRKNWTRRLWVEGGKRENCSIMSLVIASNLGGWGG